MSEKELREEAIRRYENGESPKEIYQSLRKAKTDGRFYSANIIDAYDRRCSVNPIIHTVSDWSSAFVFPSASNPSSFL